MGMRDRQMGKHKAQVCKGVLNAGEEAAENQIRGKGHEWRKSRICFFFWRRTAYESFSGVVGSGMYIKDRTHTHTHTHTHAHTHTHTHTHTHVRTHTHTHTRTHTHNPTTVSF